MNTIDLQAVRTETARMFLEIQAQMAEREAMLKGLISSEEVMPYAVRELNRDVELLRTYQISLGELVTHFATEAAVSLHQV